MSAHPSPLNDTLPPTVSMLPTEEVEAFRHSIVARYARQIKKGFAKKALSIFVKEEVQELSDDDYIQFLTMTTCAKLISNRLTDKDRKTFDIADNDARNYYLYDFSNIDNITPMDGVHLVKNIALISKDSNGIFHPEAIWLNNVVFRRGDNDAWNLAKYYVTSTAVFCTLFSEHPMVHFPMDAVNAITKSVFPKDHLVLKLLLPHTYLQLPLNFGVLYQHRSVMYNNPDEIYTPFPHKNTNELLQQISNRYNGTKRGIARQSKFRYPMEKREEVTEYDHFLNIYYDVIFEFVKNIVQHIPANDPYIRQWAQKLSAIVHGFPDDEAIGMSDNLARVTTGYIWNCSVVHSADHHVLGEFPLNKVPFRIRVAPPSIARDFKLNRKLLMNQSDIFRQKIAIDMFVKAHPITHLVDVDYLFQSAELTSLNEQFVQKLKQTDKDLSVHRFMKAADFAASIQY